MARRSPPPTSRWTGIGRSRAAPRERRAPAGPSTPNAEARATSFACSSGPPIVAPAPRAIAARGRNRNTPGGFCRCCRGANTKRLQLPGRGRRPTRAEASTPSGRASRAPSRRRCEPLACVRRATAAWPRQACSTSPPPRPSTSIAWPLGSLVARSRPRAPRGSPRSPPDGPLRQQGAADRKRSRRGDLSVRLPAAGLETHSHRKSELSVLARAAPLLG